MFGHNPMMMRGGSPLPTRRVRYLGQPQENIYDSYDSLNRGIHQVLETQRTQQVLSQQAAYPSAHQILQYFPGQQYSGPSGQQLQYHQLIQKQQQLQPRATKHYDMLSQIAPLTDYLFLCGAHALNIERVRSLGITHVINATMEIADVKAPEIQTIRVMVDDIPSARLCAFFDRIADNIDQIHRMGGRVLVHCVAGVSRSSSLCIAYLMKYHRMPLLDAYRFVKSRRPVIRPNIGFFRQLIDFEKKLFGKATVKFINSSIGPIPDVYEQQAKHMVYFGK